MSSASGLPSPPSRTPPRAFPTVGWWLIWLLLALAIMNVAGPRTSLNPRSLLPEMIEGTSARPYVRRALVAVMVRGADALIPAGARAALEARVAESPRLHDRLRWDPEHATWYALVFAIHVLALVGFAAAFRGLLAHTMVLGPNTSGLGATAALALAPIHFGYQNFIYDFPALALFTLGLLFLFERRWVLFYLLWPIGLLNKETFVLLVPVFVITQWRALPRAAMLRHVLAQIAGFVAVAAVLVWVFRANRGEALEWHLLRNFTDPAPLRQRIHDAAYVAFWVFAFFWWTEKRVIAGSALAVMGVLFTTTLFFGFLGEYRDFYEAWPLVALMATHTALRLFRGRPLEAGV